MSDEEWADLIARRGRDGCYGVLTTGVLCRYGCPSRPPLRQNARSFASVAAALAAGLRPCKRCCKDMDRA